MPRGLAVLPAGMVSQSYCDQLTQLTVDLIAFEESSDRKQVRCRICSEGNVTGLNIWMQRGSWKKHMESSAHETEVMRGIERNNQRAADAAQLLELQQASVLEEPNFSDAASEIQGTAYSNSLPMFTTNAIAVSSSDNPPSHPLFSTPAIPAFMLPNARDSDLKREQLIEHYNLLLRQAEHEDEFGREDEDDYGLVDEIRDLGTISTDCILVFANHNVTCCM